MVYLAKYNHSIYYCQTHYKNYINIKLLPNINMLLSFKTLVRKSGRSISHAYFVAQLAVTRPFGVKYNQPFYRDLKELLSVPQK